MSKVKSLAELSALASDITPRMFGEVFEDGQFRGHSKVDDVPISLVIGEYMLWEMDDKEQIGIGYRVTGEMGIFKVADFEPHLKAFFGLNF